MTPTAVTDLQTLGHAYISFAQGEIPPGRQRPRSPQTISSFRRAVEGFVAAAAGRDLTTLPDDFIEVDWLQTQQSVLKQAIQLRVRVSAVNKFINWLQLNGIAVPKTLRLPRIETPEAKKTKEPSMSNTDVTQLADPGLNENPVPSVNTHQYQPTTSLPVSVPPPQPPPPRPQQPKREAQNPLASIFPSAGNGWKLRVRRERETGEDPVFINDFPLDRVQLFGAVEPFLVREVGPKVATQGITGDVTFVVSAVDTRGGETEKRRMTVTVAPMTSVPAPVAGAVALPMPMAPVASSREEIAEVLSIDRRAREEERAAIETRLTERIVPASAAPTQHSSEMEDMRRTLGQLASTVTALAERVMTPPPAPVAPPQQPQQPDMLGMLKVLMEMTRPAPVAPPPPQQTLTDVFAMLGQAKSMFAPANVNIDVSPLEEQLHDLRKQLSETKKGGLAGVLEEVKVAKELFNLVDPTASARPSTTLSSALGGVIEKAFANPAPFAEAVEKVLNGLAALKSGQPAPQHSNPSTTQSASRTTALPRPLVDASVALLSATTAETQAVATYDWLKVLVQVPETAKVAERLSGLLKQGKGEEFAIVLRQVLTHLGYGQHATPQVTVSIAKSVMAKLAANNPGMVVDDVSAEELLAADEETDGNEDEVEDDESEDESEDEEESDNSQNPDLTVRVGGSHDGEEEDEEEGTEEGEDEDGLDPEATDDEPGEDDPMPMPEPAPEPEAPKRGRRNKKAAANPVVELNDLPVQAGKPEVTG